MERGQLEVVGVSGNSAKNVCFRWTLNNFNILLNEKDGFFSPEFQVELYTDCTKWKIQLCPCAPYEQSPGGYRPARIYLLEATHPKVTVTVEYNLFNSLGLNVYPINSTCQEISKGSSILSFSKSSFGKILNSISHDNKVILLLKLNASLTNHPATLIREPPIANSKFSINDSESSIVNDFAKLRMDKESSDFTISVRGNEFHAHRIILRARSRLFSSMFKHAMKKADPGKLEIEDIEPKVIEDFLNFIYTGNPKIGRNDNELLAFCNESSIVNDFNKLRIDGESSDFTIFVRGNEFHVHKIILGARSRVFSSMFKHDMKEANSCKLEIEDIEPEVIEEFLNFIYTGNAKIEGKVNELLGAAEKYDVQDLKAFCEETLIKDLSKENCFKTLVLSDLYSAKNLKKQAINFVISNNHVVDKNGLAEINDLSLAKELIEALLNRMN